MCACKLQSIDWIVVITIDTNVSITSLLAKECIYYLSLVPGYTRVNNLKSDDETTNCRWILNCCFSILLFIFLIIFLIVSFCYFEVFGQEELYHSLWPVLHKLYQQVPECEPFLQPVDADKLGIPVSLCFLLGTFIIIMVMVMVTMIYDVIILSGQGCHLHLFGPTLNVSKSLRERLCHVDRNGTSLVLLKLLECLVYKLFNNFGFPFPGLP